MGNIVALKKLVGQIIEPNRQKCLTFIDEYIDKFIAAPGSKTKHQAWSGGYTDHIVECMLIAEKQYEWMNKRRSLPFTLSDVFLVLFLHDIEKLFKYTDERYVLETDEEKWLFLEETCTAYTIALTPEHWNALAYIHGEGSDYHRTKRVMEPLAAFVHCCDIISARIWFDQPQKEQKD